MATDRSRPANLLLGNYRPTIALVRHLSRRGHRVVVTRGGAGTAHLSRHCAELWDHPPFEEADAFFAALADHVARRPDIGIVMPVWEPRVKALAERIGGLPADRTYATPPARTVLTCLDKAAMLGIAAAAGVPNADFALVEDLDALVAHACRIGFPAIVRPLASATPIQGRKALILDDAAALAALLPRWPEGDARLIVQRYVSGPVTDVYVAAMRGRPLGMMAARVLRTNAVDGTGFTAAGVAVALDPLLADHAARIVGLFGYHGVACLQFITNPENGETTFFEVNRRFSGSVAMPIACWLDLPDFAIRLAAGPVAATEVRGGRTGVTRVSTFGEARRIRAARRAGAHSGVQTARALAAALRTALSVDLHVTWDWRDPLPTLANYARGLAPA